MRYLMGKSKHTGNVYTGLLPDDSHLEEESNREWEREITKEEFDNLTKTRQMTVVMMGQRVQVYQVQA